MKVFYYEKGQEARPIHYKLLDTTNFLEELNFATVYSIAATKSEKFSRVKKLMKNWPTCKPKSVVVIKP